jgi:hypothetical protein
MVSWNSSRQQDGSTPSRFRNDESIGRSLFDSSRFPCIRSATTEQVNHRPIERRNIVGLADRYEISIDHDLLINPLWAGIPQVGFERTGLPASKKLFTNATAAGCMRRASGCMTPPGNSNPSKSLAFARSRGTSTGNSLLQLTKFQATYTLILGRRHDAGFGTRLIERLPWLNHFDLLETQR